MWTQAREPLSDEMSLFASDCKINGNSVQHSVKLAQSEHAGGSGGMSARYLELVISPRSNTFLLIVVVGVDLQALQFSLELCFHLIQGRGGISNAGIAARRGGIARTTGQRGVLAAGVSKDDALLHDAGTVVAMAAP